MNAVPVIQQSAELIGVAVLSERRIHLDYHATQFDLELRTANSLAGSEAASATEVPDQGNLLITSRLTATATISVSRAWGSR